MPKIHGESVVYTSWEKITVSMIGLLAGIGMTVSAWSLKLQLDNKDNITTAYSERQSILKRIQDIEVWGPRAEDPFVRASSFSRGINDVISEMRALRTDVSAIREATARTEEQLKTVNMRINYIEKNDNKP